MRKRAILIILAIFFFGCKNNPLDITPNGRTTLNDVFQDEQETEAYLNTVYGQLLIPSYFYYSYFSLLTGVTDDAVESDVGNNAYSTFTTWISGGLTPSSNPLNDYYATYWTGIRYANVFLSRIDDANVPNEAFKKRFKAEARVLRAYYYWELIKQYGPMPIIKEPLSASFDYTTLKRPTFQDDVDFIVSDCDSAIANPYLPMRITVAAERGRVTKAVAYAIESEALLFNASPLWNPNNDITKWQAAAKASKNTLDALTANGEYALAKDYGEYFLNQSDISNSPNDKETIFEIPGVAGVHLILQNDIPSKQGGEKAGSCPTQELVDCYDMQATGEPPITGYNDAQHLSPIINTSSGYNPDSPYVGRYPRFYATIWYNGAQYNNVNGNIHTIQTFIGGSDQLIKSPPNRSNTSTGYYLRKFIDPQLQINQSSNATWKVFRLAEIYLNLAEAENEAYGPDDIAYNAINTIRERVNMPDLPKGLSKDEFRTWVHNERRVEFAFEGQRFWDVRRWKILDQTGKLVTGMEIQKQPDNSFTYQRFVTQTRNAWQDKYLIYPIPLGDVSDIPDFSEHQNPGW